MKTHRILRYALAISLWVTGCAERVTGISYESAVQGVDRTLTSKVDRGIFPFTKNSDGKRTEFRFIEGSRLEKVDHAFPLRITVAITPEDGGAGSAYEVSAFKHGLKMKARDREAETRWRAEIERSILEGE